MDNPANQGNIIRILFLRLILLPFKLIEAVLFVFSSLVRRIFQIFIKVFWRPLRWILSPFRFIGSFVWQMLTPLVQRLLEGIRGFVQIYPKEIILVQATPNQCVEMLKLSAKPSTKRLHQRDLFREGRRYFVHAREDGFKMTTTRKVYWHHRRRTSSATLIIGKFTRFDENTTQLELTTRMNILYLLTMFFFPIVITMILISTLWSRQVVYTMLAMFYLVTWLGRKYHTALEAHDMLHYVRTVLGDVIPKSTPELPDSGPDVVYGQHEFLEIWERFYQEQETP